MTKLNQVYRCSICGNITEVLHSAAGELVCCGKPMTMLIENSEEASTEKHIPIISRENNGLKIIVGEIEHPMTEDHLIIWIEIITAEKKFIVTIFKPETNQKFSSQ
jgi:superoxide reductase